MELALTSQSYLRVEYENSTKYSQVSVGTSLLQEATLNISSDYRDGCKFYINLQNPELHWDTSKYQCILSVDGTNEKWLMDSSLTDNGIEYSYALPTNTSSNSFIITFRLWETTYIHLMYGPYNAQQNGYFATGHLNREAIKNFKVGFSFLNGAAGTNATFSSGSLVSSNSIPFPNLGASTTPVVASSGTPSEPLSSIDHRYAFAKFGGHFCFSFTNMLMYKSLGYSDWNDVKSKLWGTSYPQITFTQQSGTVTTISKAFITSDGQTLMYLVGPTSYWLDYVFSSIEYADPKKSSISLSLQTSQGVSFPNLGQTGVFFIARSKSLLPVNYTNEMYKIL